jgi:cystathionine gamma-synthase
MQGFGGALSFTLKDGSDSVRSFRPLLNDARLAANHGAVETVVDLPETTSHVGCTLREQAAMDIPEGLIRYSAGIENTEDLIDDLRQALSARQ